MSLTKRDKKHLWHPLTQHQLYPDHIAITKAKGAILYDEQNNEYIDAIASWYTCMYGHCNPFITERTYKQMQELDHVVFSGFTHRPAVELSEELIKILPNNQQKIFFSDNGSTSVEVGIKMALQYHFNNNEAKNKIIALKDAFHGDTFGAMSASGLSVYNNHFKDFFIKVDRISVPTQDNFIEVKKQFEELINTKKVACFIYEPLVQGANCMQMFESGLLNQLIEIAQKNNALCIADEVMTGFGKTGALFASELIDNKPDIICMSKSLTAGLVPMAITTTTQKVYDAFLSNKNDKGFFHGHTYSANPVACSAALAGIELLQTKEMQQNIQRIIRSHQAFDKKIKQNPKIKNTRQLGVIYAMDIDAETNRYGDLQYKLFRFYMKNGVCLRPLGNTVYILPPFIISNEQLQKVYNVIEQSLKII